MISEARSNGAAGRAGQEQPKRWPDDSHPLAPLIENIAQLREFAAYYLSTRVDAVKLRLRRAAFAVALGLVGVVTAAAGLVMAVVLFLLGAARGLEALLGGRAWAGDLIVGGAVIVGAVVVSYLVARILAKSSRRQTVERYERQRSAQRARFGRDASDRVAAE